MAAKKIEIDGRKIKFKASAATPLYYRKMFGRDIFADMNKLTRDVEERGEQEGKSGSEIPIQSLAIFQDVAYCMAKQADPEIPEQMEWFDQFEMFSIYNVLEEIIELWGVDQKTTVEAKKKFRQLQES